MIKQKEVLDIIISPLIGKDAEIVDSDNASLIGIKGRIIDETKNTISLESEGAVKKIIKSQIMLKLCGHIVPGKALIEKPEERIKAKTKKLKFRLLVKQDGR